MCEVETKRSMHNWYILVPCRERVTNPYMSRTREKEMHIKCIKYNQWLTSIPSTAPARNPRDNSSGLTKENPLNPAMYTDMLALLGRRIHRKCDIYLSSIGCDSYYSVWQVPKAS